MPFEGRSESIIEGGAEAERGALAGHAFAGMAVQFVLFCSIEWGVGLLMERERGLWKRIRASPVSKLTLLVAKILGSLIVSFLIIAAVFGFGAIVFGIRVRGSFPGFLLISASFAWMAANFGLLVAALGRSPQGARSVAILAVLVMVMLGGGWIPGFLFPGWLQSLTPAIPARWAIEGFDGVLSRGYTFADATPMVLASFGFGAGFGTLALATFRWAEPS
jgi:ABC-2 type transport system permease protein